MRLLHVITDKFSLFSFVIKIFTFQDHSGIQDERSLKQFDGINKGYKFTFIFIFSHALTIVSINHNWLVTGCNQI